MRLDFYGDYETINETFLFREVNFYENILRKEKVMT